LEYKFPILLSFIRLKVIQHSHTEDGLVGKVNVSNLIYKLFHTTKLNSLQLGDIGHTLLQDFVVHVLLARFTFQSSTDFCFFFFCRRSL